MIHLTLLPRRDIIIVIIAFIYLFGKKRFFNILLLSMCDDDTRGKSRCVVHNDGKKVSV